MEDDFLYFLKLDDISSHIFVSPSLTVVEMEILFSEVREKMSLIIKQLFLLRDWRSRETRKVKDSF